MSRKARPVRHPHRRHGSAVLAALTTTAALVGAGLTALSAGPAEAATARQVEALDLGVVSVHTDAGNLVGWRWPGTDPDNGHHADTKVNSTPVTGSTNHLHAGAVQVTDGGVGRLVGVGHPVGGGAARGRAVARARARRRACRRIAPVSGRSLGARSVACTGRNA